MEIERREHKRLNPHEVIMWDETFQTYELWVDGEYYCTLTQEEYYEVIEENGWVYK